MSKRFAIYTVVNDEERFIGQAFLSEADLEAIEKSFAGELQSEHIITLTDGETIEVSKIDSIEEIRPEDGE